MKPQSVLGIHLICHNGESVVELLNDHFETRAWVLDRRTLKVDQLYVALHERQNLASYRQGLLTGWKPDSGIKGRVSLTVCASSAPLQWVGEASGETGLARAENPLSRRNLSLVTGPRAYLARMCWNSQGWRYATGEARELESSSSFVARIGFGHEEWLFNQLWTLKGWRYGFLEPVHSHRDSHIGEIIDVGLYTIDCYKRRCWVGRIHRAEILTDTEARQAAATFEKRGLLNQMRSEVSAIEGSSTETLKADVPGFSLFNIRFRPEHLEVSDPPKPLPRSHRVWTLNRYNLNLANAADFSLAQSAGTHKLRPEIFDPRNPTGPTPISALHNKIQNCLFRLLEQRYGKGSVVFEKAQVDLVVEHPDLYAFIEVKSDPEARLALRNAIGQLLEYTWYEQPDGRRPELIVAAPGPMTPAVRSYLSRLREKVGLKIHYLQITLETAELPIWQAGGFSESGGNEEMNR